jgi:hypothetical protein
MESNSTLDEVFMWLGQHTTSISVVLQDKLAQCKKLIEAYEKTPNSDSYAPFINYFKTTLNSLSLDLLENDSYDAASFKKLRRLVKQSITQFSGKFQHRRFVQLCKKLYAILNEALI